MVNAFAQCITTLSFHSLDPSFAILSPSVVTHTEVTFPCYRFRRTVSRAARKIVLKGAWFSPFPWMESWHAARALSLTTTTTTWWTRFSYTNQSTKGEQNVGCSRLCKQRGLKIVNFRSTLGKFQFSYYFYGVTHPAAGRNYGRYILWLSAKLKKKEIKASSFTPALSLAQNRFALKLQRSKRKISAM